MSSLRNSNLKEQIHSSPKIIGDGGIRKRNFPFLILSTSLIYCNSVRRPKKMKPDITVQSIERCLVTDQMNSQIEVFYKYKTKGCISSSFHFKNTFFCLLLNKFILICRCPKYLSVLKIKTMKDSSSIFYKLVIISTRRHIQEEIKYKII